MMTGRVTARRCSASVASGLAGRRIGSAGLVVNDGAGALGPVGEIDPVRVAANELRQLALALDLYAGRLQRLDLGRRHVAGDIAVEDAVLRLPQRNVLHLPVILVAHAGISFLGVGFAIVATKAIVSVLQLFLGRAGIDLGRRSQVGAGVWRRRSGKTDQAGKQGRDKRTKVHGHSLGGDNKRMAADRTPAAAMHQSSMTAVV